NYQVGTQHSTRQTVDTEGAVTLALPIVMPDSQAKAVADSVLYSAWLARTSYVFRLPMRYAWLEPADVVRVHVGGAAHTVRIMETRFGKPGVVEIEAVAEDSSLYDFASTPGENAIAPAAAPPVSATALEMLDIPAFP